MRRECEASLRRLKVDAIDLYQIHWPEPDEDVEEGWGDAGAAEGGRQGALDRRLELQRGADGALPRDRARHVAAAAVFGGFAGGGEREILPYCQQHGHRRDRVFADEIGPAHRQDDQGAGGGSPAGRFPATRARPFRSRI